MSSLGPYQELTTRASRLGGVDALIVSIEKSAVLKAAPKQVGLGVVGTLGAVCLVYAGVKVHHRWERRHTETIKSGEQAKTELTEVFSGDEDTASDGADSPEPTAEGE